ncbi:MAG: response regulator [Anaerolineales bacterium]
MSEFVVLLIDDEKAYAKVIQDALEAAGIKTYVANNAEEALMLYQEITPNLVLLDVMMPDIDGLTLLRWLREHSERDEIPIHIISAKSMPADHKAAIQAGANGFLAKPFTLDELREVLVEYIPDSATNTQ